MALSNFTIISFPIHDMTDPSYGVMTFGKTVNTLTFDLKPCQEEVVNYKAHDQQTFGFSSSSFSADFSFWSNRSPSDSDRLYKKKKKNMRHDLVNLNFPPQNVISIWMLILIHKIRVNEQK